MSNYSDLPNDYPRRTALVRFVTALSVLVLTMLAPTRSLVAQPPPSPPVSQEPTIGTTARGESRVTPDRATVNIGVETRAATAAAAARANAERLTRVLDAIKRAGVPESQIRTVGFNVFPEFAHERDKPPRVTGYRTANTVVVEVRDIARVGVILDTALAAGANAINAINFSSSRVEEARRVALAAAVDKARLDAEALAKAAGGSLGQLVQLTTTDGDRPRPMADFAVSSEAVRAAPTPIEPGEYTVSVSVMARWRFVAGR